MNDVLVVNGVEFKFPYSDVSELQKKMDSLVVFLKLSGIKFRFFMDKSVDHRDVYNLAIMKKTTDSTIIENIFSDLYIEFIDFGDDKIINRFVIFLNADLFEPARSFEGVNVDDIMRFIDEMMENL